MKRAYDEAWRLLGEGNRHAVSETVEKALKWKRLYPRSEFIAYGAGLLVLQAEAFKGLECYAEAIEVCDKVDAMETIYPNQIMPDFIARSAHIRGTAQFYTGQYAETIQTFESVIQRFQDIEHGDLGYTLESAYYNIACSYSRLGNVAEVVRWLTTWADHRGGFDCKEIAGDSDFDVVRAKPAFKKLVSRFGCAGEKFRGHFT